MGKLSWIIWVDPKCTSNHMCLYKRETGGSSGKRWEGKGRDQSDAAAAQGTPAAPKAGRGKKQILH